MRGGYSAEVMQAMMMSLTPDEDEVQGGVWHGGCMAWSIAWHSMAWGIAWGMVGHSMAWHDAGGMSGMPQGKVQRVGCRGAGLRVWCSCLCCLHCPTPCMPCPHSLHATLLPVEAIAAAAAAEDWARDTASSPGGAVAMSFDSFKAAMFELADLW